MKKILKVDRLRLRGMSGARDEFLLTATAQNLRRMAQWIFKLGQCAEKNGRKLRGFKYLAKARDRSAWRACRRVTVTENDK